MLPNTNENGRVYRTALGKVAWAQQKAQLHGLSVRTTNRLLTAGLTTREQIVSALTQSQNGQCSRISGLGVKGYREVCSWVGVTPPQQNQRRRILYLC